MLTTSIPELGAGRKVFCGPASFAFFLPTIFSFSSRPRPATQPSLHDDDDDDVYTFVERGEYFLNNNNETYLSTSPVGAARGAGRSTHTQLIGEIGVKGVSF